MFTRLAQLALLCIVLSLPLLTKKESDRRLQKQGSVLLDEAIRKQQELENGSRYDSEGNQSDDYNWGDGSDKIIKLRVNKL